MNTVPDINAVQSAIDDVLRRERGRLLAGLIARLGDFQLAEDALQEAAISALRHWGRSGIPDSPAAWLMKAGFNKGIDQIRKNRTEAKAHEAIELPALDPIPQYDLDLIPDERLRLIFTCCHPALEEKSRLALTLRTVCGLTTREIAAAFLDTEQTMGQRLSRAKSKIKAKGIGFSVPDSDQWPVRLQTVLSTLYLIFTTGYVNEDMSSRDLCKEGIYLVRLLNTLQPETAEVEGTLALMLFTEARRNARIGHDDALIPVEEQDAGLWDQSAIQEAQDLMQAAVNRRKPGPFQIKAAIADCHMFRPKPDWHQMALLYQSLWAFEPTPVVALNWAVTIAEEGQPNAALQRLDELESQLRGFQPWYAAKAHILEELGRTTEALMAYKTAMEMAPNEASKKLLMKKMQITASVS